MRLARIISRSHKDCRELAVDLLARGYAVEIVSPDAIPDNFADLELRVESDAANQTTAHGAASADQQAAYLEFIHHLDAPMGDFVRRTPRMDAAPAPVAPAPLNPTAAEVAIEVAADVVAPVATDRPEPPVPAMNLPSEEIEVTNSAEEPEDCPPPVRNLEQQSTSGVTVVFRRPKSGSKVRLKIPNLVPVPALRPMISLFTVGALVAVLAMGIRRGDPIVQSAKADSPMAGASSPSAAESLPAAHHVDQAERANSSPTPQGSQPASSRLENARPAGSGRKSKTLIARDLPSEDATVFREKPTGKTADHSRHQKTHRAHRSDSVAKDTVTYLDKRFAQAPRSR